ncbi:unnamed protein product [Darwinula stevensoni]|uniref:Splicing factor 3B subunit 1 n=1 Tax=Darwinula stevensoni TaxID=69355 RepID=A0A7R9FNH3_9CRUS|nr:unnamed protein product [Darwinula stevensoni]CAG0896458.1 unnamed protein product [Darwinula stevensoni]
MDTVAKTHEDIEAQIREIQERKKGISEGGPEADRIGLGEAGYFDKDIYGGKGKFEGYVTSIAANEEQDDDEYEPPAQRENKRTSYTAPLALLNDIPQADKDYDPFAEHKRPTIADREDEYKQKRRRLVISPERVDPFADGGKTPDINSRTYAAILKEQSLKAEEHETPGHVHAHWEETPGHARSGAGGETPGGAATPSSTRLWDATPGHATPGHEKATPSARRNRWDETPKTERETPGHGSGWAETPRTDRTGAAGDLIQETPTPSASKRRSRWDETPGTVGGTSVATPTPVGAATPQTPGTPMTPVTPGMMTPSGVTPTGHKAMAMATPTPGE